MHRVTIAYQYLQIRPLIAIEFNDNSYFIYYLVKIIDIASTINIVTNVIIILIIVISVDEVSYQTYFLVLP